MPDTNAPHWEPVDQLVVRPGDGLNVIIDGKSYCVVVTSVEDDPIPGRVVPRIIGDWMVTLA